VSVLNISDIMRRMPHRYPMLLVDRIVEIDKEEQSIIGLKNVTINEPFFQGHFPGIPVMPGVLQLEAMAQTAGVLLNEIADMSGHVAYFMTIDKAKFRKVVVPGDQLMIHVRFLKFRSTTARFEGKIMVDDNVVSEAQMLCMITEEKADT